MLHARDLLGLRSARSVRVLCLNFEIWSWERSRAVLRRVHVRLRWNDKLQDRTRLVTELLATPSSACAQKAKRALHFRFPHVPGDFSNPDIETTELSFGGMLNLCRTRLIQ